MSEFAFDSTTLATTECQRCYAFALCKTYILQRSSICTWSWLTTCDWVPVPIDFHAPSDRSSQGGGVAWWLRLWKDQEVVGSNPGLVSDLPPLLSLRVLGLSV